MAKAKKRRAKKRQSVKREERHPATPETLAKLQRDPMDILIRRGAAAKGIDEQHFDSLWEITEGSLVVCRGLGYQTTDLDRVGHGSNGDMSRRDARLWDIYSYHFSQAFLRATYTAPSVVREWVQGDRQIKDTDIPLLLQAAKIWDRCASSYDKAVEAERNEHNRMLTAA